MLTGIRKPTRNRLKQNFQVAYQAWLLHCSICDQNILLNGMQPSKWEDENHNKHKRAKASHFSPGSGFTILICCFSIPIRFPLPSLSLSLSLSISLPLALSFPVFFFLPPLAHSLPPLSYELQASTTHTTIGPIYQSAVTSLPKQLLWVVRVFIKSMIPTNAYCLKCMIETLRCVRELMRHIYSRSELLGQIWIREVNINNSWIRRTFRKYNRK